MVSLRSGVIWNPWMFQYLTGLIARLRCCDNSYIAGLCACCRTLNTNDGLPWKWYSENGWILGSFIELNAGMVACEGTAFVGSLGPGLYLNERQDPNYWDDVLPYSVRVRVAVEAGLTFSRRH
jgi:hypothetical protein